MTEKFSTPDLEYAKQVRFGDVGKDDDPYRAVLDMEAVGAQVKTPDTLTPEAHAEIDRILNAIQRVRESNTLRNKMGADNHANFVDTGNVLAGLNTTGVKGESKIGLMTPEEFHEVMSRSLGGVAISIYQDKLQELANTEKTAQPEIKLVKEEPREEPTKLEEVKINAHIDQIDEAVGGSQEANFKKQLQFKEVLEVLGLPEETSLEDFKLKINNEIENIQAAKGAADLENRDRIIYELMQCQNEQKNLLSGSSRDILKDYLERLYPQLITYLEDNKKTVPKQLVSRFKDDKMIARRLASASEELLSRGLNYIDTEAAYKTRIELQKMVDISNLLSTTQLALEQYRNDIVGFSEQEVEPEGLEFANEQVKEWSDELNNSSTTPERIKQIENEMMLAVARESEMIDDPNSPSQWFNESVRDNRSKSRREGTQFSGRQDANIPAQQHVAELMSDILRDKFNIEHANLRSSSIVLKTSKLKGDRVSLGKHRVAALAMLYGNQWQKQAAKLGIRVDKDS